ncbi:MAG TPA: T9SS type A sorting domain-containing protein [Candidatus Kapabacteria bacterium]|nr:T9SS type A sorting domain-containing protein [Candidatus Kapabacteria bacterium]
MIYATSTYNWDTDVLLTVRSERWVTTRYASVCIEDSTAHSLMAGLPPPIGLDSSNTTLKNRAQALTDSINAAEQTLRDTLHGRLEYYYLYDEPGVSEFAAHGRVNAIIGDSGETERSIYEERRYAAQTNSKTFRGGFDAEPWNAGGGVYFDKGPGWGQVSCSPTVATLQSYGQTGYGYFPVKSGSYVPDSVYAYDTTYPLQYGDYTCGTGSTDYSFDFYDFSRNNSNPMLQTLNDYVHDPNPFEAAVLCDSIIYLDTTTGHPKEWWAYSSMSGATNDDIDWSNNPYPDTGYYTGETAETPELMSVMANNVICMGARGLSYWWATTGGNPDGIGTGFTNDSGWNNSDYDTIFSYRLPTMYHRLCEWAGKYSSWLKNYYDSTVYMHGKWLGGYIRTYVNTQLNDTTISVDSLKPFTESIGTNPITAPTGDSSWRYVLDSVKSKHAIGSWAANADSFRYVRMGDTIVDEIKMPQALCWETQGYFQDTTQKDPAKPNYFLTVVNNFIDCRDLLCRFKPYDSIFISRGERNIQTKLALSPNVSQFWTLAVLDSTHDSVTVAYNGSFTWHYFPGEMHVFSIHPAWNFHIGQGNIDYSNGRRAEWDSFQGIYHVTYYRNDSIFYRQSLNSTGASWSAEQCIAAPVASVDTFSHPSLRVMQNGNAYAVGITYEMEDTSLYYIYIRVNTIGDLTSWGAPVLLHSYKKKNAAFTPTPVLAPFITASDTGFIVAWADSMGVLKGIGLCAYDFNWNAPFVSPIVYVNAINNGHIYPATITDSVSGFPSIMEDSTTSSCGLAFQQQRGGNQAQIFFTTLSINNVFPPQIATPIAVPDWVSRIYGPDCDNLHPCLDRSQAMDITTPSIVMAGGGGGGAPAFAAVRPNVGNVGIQPHTPPSSPMVWNIVWDAPIITGTFVMGQLDGGGPDTTEAIWQAMEPRGMTSKWVYNLFRPPAKVMDKYYYPSVRAFDGTGTTSNLASVIGWWTSDNLVLFANSPSAYPSALGTPNYIIHPLEEAGITETTVFAPPQATTPNLEMNSHDNSWYNNQRAIYKDLRMPDIRMLGMNIPNLDTAGSWIWQGATAYQLKDTSSRTTCIQETYVGYNPKDPTAVIIRDSLHLPPGDIVTQFIPLDPRKDSLGWKTGIFAVTDTLHLNSTDSTLIFYRSCYSPDTVGLAGSIGSGNVRYYIEAASYATGATLKTIDSLVIQTGNLKNHSDSIIANMSALIDSVVFFRIRVVDTTTPNLAGVIAQAYTPLDTNNESNLAKDIHHLGRGIDAVLSDPLMLTVAPNPVRDQTNVSFTITDVDDAQNTTECIVFDMMGKTVATLAKDQLTLGQHSVTFNAANLPSGSYIVAVHTLNHMQSKLMILTK